MESQRPPTESSLRHPNDRRKIPAGLALLVLILFVVGVGAGVYFVFFHERPHTPALTIPIDDKHSPTNRVMQKRPVRRPRIPVGSDGQFVLTSPLNAPAIFVLMVPPNATRGQDLHFDLRLNSLMSGEDRSWFEFFNHVTENPSFAEAAKVTPEQLVDLSKIKIPEPQIPVSRRDEMLVALMGWRTATASERVAHPTPTTLPTEQSIATDAAATKLVNAFTSLANEVTHTGREQVATMINQIRQVLKDEQRMAYKKYLLEQAKAASNPTGGPATLMSTQPGSQPN